MDVRRVFERGLILSTLVGSGCFIAAAHAAIPPPSGCAICQVNGCNLGPGEFTRPSPNPPVDVKKCVDYDGIDPAHCAWVLRFEFIIYGNYGGGNCYMINCANGTPINSEVCTNPWRSQPVQPPPPIRANSVGSSSAASGNSAVEGCSL